MKKYIDVAFELGEFVYLKTDPEQNARMITSIQVTPQGCLYRLTLGTIETWHYDLEISVEKSCFMGAL